MQQILQDLRDGKVQLADLPAPHCRPGQVLIQTTRTLVSLGTEKMLLQFGRSGWIGKAKSQPEKVKQVLQKIKTDGLKPTIDAVRNKLDQPLPLGYCNVGVVLEVGAQVSSLKAGDRVVSNGPHAEIVCVPELLCAKVPDGVDDETAAFTVISAIGLQGIRLMAPTLGETFVVIGLGLIGLLSVQILRAHGCEVIGFDLDQAKVDLAAGYGAKTFRIQEGFDPVTDVLRLTHEIGADGVLITAATDSEQPIQWAAKMARHKGRIVLVGVTGLKLSRDEFFKKELSFQVSCSYGPGRYDINYEQRGLDYPIGFVRWTEQRNFAAVLGLMERNQLTTGALVSERVQLSQAVALYETLSERRGILGVVLQFPKDSRTKAPPAATPMVRALRAPEGTATIGVIGAGQFAHSTLLPAFKKTEAVFHTIVGRQGVNTHHLGKKFGFAHATTNSDEVIGHPEINCVVISTPHHTHADLVCRALKAGQNVFVEKPLALSHGELDQIQAVLTQSRSAPLLMLGFNRRFSPLTQKLKAELSGVSGPMALVMTVNAGSIPRDHWTQDLTRGGGRLIGEGCHFFDLLRHLAGSPIVAGETRFADSECRDTFTTTMAFANGSIGTVHYFANGNRGFAKETLQVFAGGKIFQLDNFRRLKGFGTSRSMNHKLWSQDKGHINQVNMFIYAVSAGGESPIALAEIFEVSRWTLNFAGLHQPLITSGQDPSHFLALK